MSRRRGHCPKRRRGEPGGGGAGGPGRLGRGSGCGAQALEPERSTWARCPPSLPSQGKNGVPGPIGPGGQGRERGPQAGEGARAPLRLRLLFRLQVLQRSGLGSFLRVQSSENFAPPPRLPPRQASPGWVGGGWGFCTKGHRPGGIWAPIMTFPGLQMGVGWERAPDYWYPPTLSP